MAKRPDETEEQYRKRVLQELKVKRELIKSTKDKDKEYAKSLSARRLLDVKRREEQKRQEDLGGQRLDRVNKAKAKKSRGEELTQLEKAYLEGQRILEEKRKAKGR